MRSDPHRWLFARLVWRWGALFWIGPSLGLLSGLVLVFVFLKENDTARASFDVGTLPQGVDVNPYLTDLRSELRSESTLIEVQRQLARDSFLKAPLWWLRPRIKVDASGITSVIHLRFTHHTASGRDKLSAAFEEVALEAALRIRAKYIEKLLAKIDAQLGEIRLAESRNEQIEGDSASLRWKRYQFLMKQPNLGYERSYPANYGRPSPPKWAILILMCSGYGLMAVFPAMIVLEMMWPMRRAPEGVITGAAQ